jgi:hypothetical protein
MHGVPQPRRNFVLGLTTLQMNREHDYGKFRDNQLRVLEHLGVLRVNWVKNMKDALRAEGRSRGMTETQVEDCTYGSRRTTAASANPWFRRSSGSLRTNTRGS